METTRKSLRGYMKKGTTYHQKFDRSRKKKADSFHNGWLSGLRKSYIQGRMSKAEYEDRVEQYKLFSGSTHAKTYRVAQWWSRKG